jgi:hypothetical protein
MLHPHIAMLRHRLPGLGLIYMMVSFRLLI